MEIVSFAFNLFGRFASSKPLLSVVSKHIFIKIKKEQMLLLGNKKSCLCLVYLCYHFYYQNIAGARSQNEDLLEIAIIENFFRRLGKYFRAFCTSIWIHS